MKKISFVIPCYHSTDTIGAVVKELIDTVSTRPEFDYEVILVNDNAPDSTWTKICALRKEYDRVKGICFSKNFGQCSALMAGYNAVSGDIVVSLDDDGQTPPSEMFKLIDAIDDETDVVYATYDFKRQSLFRRFGSLLNDLMARWLLHKPKDLYLASYFCAKRFVINEVVKYQNSYPYVDGLVLRSTERIKSVLIRHLNRTVGESGYTLKKLIKFWLNGFTAFSEKPLRLATVAGGMFSVLGFILAIIIVIKKLINPQNYDAGWTSIITLQFFLDGFIMIMLGLIGEYVGRMYISMNKSPQFIILETTDQKKNASGRKSQNVEVQDAELRDTEQESGQYE